MLCTLAMRSSSQKRGYVNYINIVCYLINVVVVLLIGQYGAFLNKPSFARLLEAYPTLLTPVDWIVHTAWPVICASELVWIVCQICHPRTARNTLIAIRHYYLGVTLAQVAWTGLWVYQVGVLYATSFCLLAALFFLLLINQGAAYRTRSLGDFWLLQFPFSIHTGWVLFLLVLNVGLVLVDTGVPNDIQYPTAIGSLSALALFGIVNLFTVYYADLVFPLSLAFGTVGVWIELQNPVEPIRKSFSDEQLGMTRLVALITTCVLVGFVVIRGIYDVVWGRSRPPLVDDDVVELALTPAEQQFVSEGFGNERYLRSTEQRRSEERVVQPSAPTCEGDGDSWSQELTAEERKFVFNA